MPNAPEPRRPHDAYAALRVAGFRRYITGNFLSVFGLQMQAVAVGWEIYERTGSKMSLAIVGLVQFVPVLSLALIVGHVADRFHRKYVVLGSLLGVSVALLGLAVISRQQAPVPIMYACLFASGIARAFLQPGKSSLLPLLVPSNIFSNAITWSTSAFQLASVLGPAAGGLVIALTRDPALVYSLAAAGCLAFAMLLLRVPTQPIAPREAPPLTLDHLFAGVQFVRGNRLILGATMIDLFAVLLGGAVALLPVFAKDILNVGPTGLGWLQAAPGIGALLMSFVQSHLPPTRHAGRDLLLAVTVFGLATIGFGISTSFALSLLMLMLTGAADNVSVVIRHSIVQLLTPDQMRGRVSAINGLFIAMSNQIGDFEAGAVAHLTSPLFSVVSGGCGTLVVVLIGLLLWPELRRYGRLDGRPTADLTPADIAPVNEGDQSENRQTGL